MNLGLAGRVAVVAGASRGIGRACAESLAREGASVALVARGAAGLDLAAAAITVTGGNALAVPADLADPRAVEAALARIGANLGKPSILVWAAAAFYQPRKLHGLGAEEAEGLWALDVAPAVGLCRRLLPDMMLGAFGRIVFLGSLAASTGIAGGTLYGAAKAALEGLARGLSVDYARRGITANVVRVGFAETERLAARVAGDPAARERLVRATATRRIPGPAEIADVVTFLCSPQAGAIAGSVVDVTAGAHLNNLW